MEDRVALAGGKERFATLLDDFFGYNGDSVKAITHLGADAEIAATAYHRFQGFNNECDLESPYAYIYAGRHDRLCEIARECVNRSFGMGKSGLPGNNDSGGLSSCFIWNALGIFPVSGKGEFLIGAPQIDESEIELNNGNRLTIIAHNRSDEHFYVDRVTFNGVEISDYKISVKELLSGGALEFYMK
jgi:putative alpha-1,2-mannosidase